MVGANDDASNRIDDVLQTLQQMVLSTPPGNLLAAIRHLLGDTPPRVEEVHSIAAAQYHVGRFEDAETTSRLLLRVNPNHYNTRYLLGNILQYTMRYAEAVQEYDQALKIQPAFEAAAVERQAIQDYQRAMRRGTAYFGPVLMSNQDARNERRPVLQALIRRVCAVTVDGDGMRILEIGSWAGGSAVLWADAIARQCERRGIVYCVDPWREFWDLQTHMSSAHRRMNDALKSGELLNLFLHNIRAARFEDIIVPLRGASSQVLPLLRDGLFDFIYVDGSHLYQDVAYDLSQVVHLVRDGGIIAGDDLPRQLEDCDSDHVRESVAQRLELATDPNSGEDYCPGVALAVAEAFGTVGMRNAVWATRRHGDVWEPVELDASP
ncbi:hypothetical protein FJZ36_12745 [Candidatus Poribacteria bacterium]|nr:hypothetical protein [Candidatus Poribacteria bacterium]